MSTFRILMAVVLGAGALLPDAAYAAGDCQSWQGLRPYVQKFFKVEGQHKVNLVKNFNALPPRTGFEPDMVGYAWFGGEKVVRLYMVAKDCVVLDRYLPRQVVWQMMAGTPAQMKVDKSGVAYRKILDAHNAEKDEAWRQMQKHGQKRFEEEGDLSEEDLILQQDIN